MTSTQKNMKQSFSLREKKKVQLVLNQYRSLVAEVVEKQASMYNNRLGCGNCGDLGPVHTTLYNLESLFGLRKGKIETE